MLHTIEMQISLKNKEWFCVYECVWRVCLYVCVCVGVCVPVCACSGAAVGEEGRKLDKFFGGEETLENSHTHALTADSYGTAQTCGFPKTHVLPLFVFFSNERPLFQHLKLFPRKIIFILKTF